MDLKISRDRLIKAASKNPQNQALVEELFPEIYSEHIKLTPKKLNELLTIQTRGLFANYAVSLSPEYHWEVLIGDTGEAVLLPTKLRKGKKVEKQEEDEREETSGVDEQLNENS